MIVEVDGFVIALILGIIFSFLSALSCIFFLTPSWFLNKPPHHSWFSKAAYWSMWAFVSFITLSLITLLVKLLLEY